jgi:hypothetical protein
VVSFPDQSPSFCRGFEAGQLWEQMCRFPIGLPPDGIAEIENTTRIENREVIERMASSRGAIPIWPATPRTTSILKAGCDLCDSSRAFGGRRHQPDSPPEAEPSTNEERVTCPKSN